jgi:hypothetical protein
METNPNSEAEIFSDENKDEFLEPVVSKKNKRGMVEVTRFQAFEDDPSRGWLTFESHPEADLWELVYYTDDPEHAHVTLAKFTTKRLREIEFPLFTELLPFDDEWNHFCLSSWEDQRMKLYVREVDMEEHYSRLYKQFVEPGEDPSLEGE